MSILLSILLALSGMTVMALADQLDTNPLQPNKFCGNVTLNGADAFTGVVIDAYIDGDHRGTITVESSGKYGDFDGLKYLDVTGNGSDDGKTITFTVCGATADQNATWYGYEAPRELNLIAWDTEAPAVTNANANPSSIVANGTDTTQLSATVIDGCTVGDVTVDLSDIGGDEAQNMNRVGDTDVYSVTVTAAEDTAPGAYCLYVNASDMLNYNDSVCIDLVIKDIEAPVVSNPDADPASIVANGTHESQLNVTVVDDSDIAFVTVDLSAIGGDAAQVMRCVGTTNAQPVAVYSVAVTAAEGTVPGVYCLYVNASDVFGNCNTSVCIALEVTTAGLPPDGNINGIGGVTLADAIYLAKHVAQMSGYETLHADGNINGIGGVTLADAIYLAKHVAQMSGYETLY